MARNYTGANRKPYPDSKLDTWLGEQWPRFYKPMSRRLLQHSDIASMLGMYTGKYFRGESKLLAAASQHVLEIHRIPLIYAETNRVT